MAPRDASKFGDWCDRALAGLFVLFCTLPAVLTWSAPPSTGAIEREFRRPAPEPKQPATLAEAQVWPAQFDAWYADHFGLRPRWIRLHNQLSLGLFGVSPTSEIVVGPDTWMFTTRDRAVDVWRGADPFTAEELELWTRVLEDRREWCSQRGVQYLFAIAPNKESIYPEYFPPRFDKFGASRREQLVAHVAQRSQVPLLDLTQAVRAAKLQVPQGEQLYYPLGTHWNDRGAVPAALALLERVHALDARVSKGDASAYRFEATEFQDDSWAGRLYLEDRLRQPNANAVFKRAIPATAWERLRLFLERRDKSPEERARFELAPLAGEPAGWSIEVESGMNVRVTRAGVAGPKALVFHDSMGEKLRPLLAEQFREIAFRWVPDFDTDAIERERPDVVLQVFVERALAATSLSTSPLDTQERLAAEFAQSSETLLAGLDGLSLPPAPKSTLAREPDGALRVDYGGSALELPELALPPGHWAIVRVELDSPLDTALLLEFLTRRFATYSRLARGVQRPLPAGAGRTLYVKLRVPGLSGRIRLHPGLAAGSYRLRSLEVRAVPQ
ncbi:MAG: alginate O-acetyltransferase AlgX-related protein [Planctomycetota bacterium]